MPNQRKKGKKLLQGWCKEDLHGEVYDFCDQNDMTVAEFLEWAAKEQIAKYKTKNKDNEKGDRNG